MGCSVFDIDSMLDIGHRSNGLFSIENITLVSKGRKSLYRVFNNSINLKMDSAKYRMIKDRVPHDMLMCDKSSAFLALISNFIDFVGKASTINLNCEFDDFSGLLDGKLARAFSGKNSNGFFPEKNISVFISFDENSRVSYSVCFTDLSFRLMSSYNDIGEHSFIFDVMGSPNNKYIIDDIEGLSIVKKHILEKSPLYKVMRNYGYEVSEDIHNEDLGKIIKIATMASH